MRMWMVNPETMCRSHLLGEHNELHMFAGCIQRGKSLRGYAEKGLVQPQSLGSRHADLVKEMVRRGYNHKSPLSFSGTIESSVIFATIDVAESERELRRRCEICRASRSAWTEEIERGIQEKRRGKRIRKWKRRQERAQAVQEPEGCAQCGKPLPSEPVIGFENRIQGQRFCNGVCKTNALYDALKGREEV